MTKRKPKSPKTQDIEIASKKPEKNEIASIDLPRSFPFENAVCLKEHKNLFESLLQGKN